MSAPLASAADIEGLLGHAVDEIFQDENEDRSRPPHQWSMSGLAGCTKQAAYKLAKQAVDADWAEFVDASRPGTLGTWIHEQVLPRLKKRFPGAVIEHPVVLRVAGVEIPGQLDFYMCAVIGGKLYAFVLDLKTVGERKLYGVRRHGPFANHRAQVRGYAYAIAAKKLPVHFVVFLYLDRATGEQQFVTEPFTYAAGEEVVTRVAEVVRWSATPDEAPRDADGPGLSIACDECPFLKSCWGPTAERQTVGGQQRLQLEDPGIEGLIRMHQEASAAMGAAKKLFEFAKAGLTGAPVAQYGPYGYGGLTHPRPEVDSWAAVKVLQEMGIAVPMRTKRGSHRIEVLGPVVDLAAVPVTEDEIPD